ncbi:MAG: hypothetical protein AB1630_06840 [bacterium]
MFKQTLSKGIACLLALGLLGGLGWAEKRPAKNEEGSKGTQASQSISFEEIERLHLLFDGPETLEKTRLIQKWRSLPREEGEEVFRRLDLLNSGVDPSIVKDDVKLYKTPIYPKKSILGGILGIRSGTVIAYGHLLKPPYYVERKGEEVFINGIRVHPLMSNPNVKIKMKAFTEEEKRQREKERKEECETVNALADYYLEVKAKEGREIASKKLLEFAKRFENIEKIEWDDEIESPFITWKHSKSKIATAIDYFAYPAPPRPTKEELRKDRIKLAKQEKESCELGLRNNRILTFDYSGETGGMDSDAKESVINIMENPKLSNKEKIKKLMILLAGDEDTAWAYDDTAKSIFYNYDPKEWKE